MSCGEGGVLVNVRIANRKNTIYLTETVCLLARVRGGIGNCVSLIGCLNSMKLAETFEAHCVDAWCLAYHVVGGEGVVTNTDIFCISPIPIRRRELHRQNPQKGGKRPCYGGTTWHGLVKNTLVRHSKYGLTRISGFSKRGIALYALEGKRLYQNAKIQDFKVLTRLNFNYRSGVSSPP